MRISVTNRTLATICWVMSLAGAATAATPPIDAEVDFRSIVRAAKASVFPAVV